MLLRASLTKLGSATLGTVGFIGAIGLLLREVAGLVPTLITAPRGRRMAWNNLWFQMYRVGVKSIGVVGLVTFCIGAILALQIGPILEDYGAADQLPTIIGVAMFRELGPLIGAIVLVGFAGASIAAELGTMAVSEELKALRSHAISPIRFLVLPRVLATTVMTVCLATFSNAMGVVGGASTAYLALGMSPSRYVEQTFLSASELDLLTGLFKAGVFGAIIGALPCYLGMNVRGGASGVGSATTNTVVFSIVALVCVDLLFTFVFYMLEL
ncbi:MAG: ABC transporter permease [Planctomycetota bacterium]